MRIVFWVVVVIFFSCGVELPDRKTMINEMYSVKVEEIRIKKRESCIKQQLEKAKSEVDSIVHRLLNADLLDTLNFPAKPIKPIRPEDIIGTVKPQEN